MRIEPGGDEYQLWPMRFASRQPALDNRRTKFRAPAAGRERNVYTFGIVVSRAAVGIHGMLERGNHQHAMIAGKYFLGAVAMMNVEIDDGDTRKTVLRHGVRRSHRDVIEQAKTHRARFLRMM